MTRHHAVVIFTAMLTLWSAVACKCLVPAAVVAPSTSSVPFRVGTPLAISQPHATTSHACCTTNRDHDRPAVPSRTDRGDCNHCLISTVMLAPIADTPTIGDLAFAHDVNFIHNVASPSAAIFASPRRTAAREGPPPRDALTLRDQHTLLTL